MDRYLETVKHMLATQTPLLNKDDLISYVDGNLKRRDTFLSVLEKSDTPSFVIDLQALSSQAESFRSVFRSELEDVDFYYAMKSNSHPEIIARLVDDGFGVDVSSGKELEEALSCGASRLIFSGPGKTHDELELACRHADRLIVLIDSFGELERLQAAAQSRDVCVRAGVRLTVDEGGMWRKFGIPLKDIWKFYRRTQECPNIEFQGLQFHSSWNMDAERSTAFIKRIGREISGLGPQFCGTIKFIDIGGGIWPSAGEWLQPSATPEGRLKQYLDPQTTEGMDHRFIPSEPLERYAANVARALREYIFPKADCTVFLEPGRWICHEAMHILLTVVDKKRNDVVITDGGTNIIGWERFEHDYFPVINLTHPSLTEHACMVFGSLCTPHDIWGYGYFGSRIEEGDVLLIPSQGAYTYSLRQDFIKPAANCELLDLPNLGGG